MLGNPGTYANKKRKKPVLKQKKVSEGNAVVKSNPSKRHRDRLNGELDRLMDLLPFSEEVRSRLDKLSVLRLSVGYLRVKSYFKATMKNNKSNLMFPGLNGQNGNSMDTTPFSEGDMLLQALNGFVMVVTSAGLVFYASSTMKNYLGFHLSDVVHQSVFELIHTDDRAIFREQLHFALSPPVAADEDALQSCGNTMMYNPEHLPPENSSFLERSFVCRFRCLLDNSSGFLALKFQGQLKYLHGQSLLTDSNRPQLALFAIAMPVQSPSIVEIRAKVLLFQTKHKLDFTPTGIDSRGKVVLGYSETELCMKGSGYQFIHAADMMHCADNHIRMLKTGESGLTVFRLLSKPGSWLWVKSNAKLIYKGGRPEFIIAYQRAISNAEGEDYLRQRRQQLPFSFTKGEATLYNTGPTVDIPQFQSNKMFSNSDMKKDVVPGSLLDCFLSQDESAYTQTVKTPLPVDQVFMDSRALVSVVSDAWQGNEAVATMSEPVVVKEETKQSVMAVIDKFEKMAENGDFCAALQTLEVDNAELIEWENALKTLGQEDPQNKVRSDLDNIVASDIFDYIDSILFKEKAEECLDTLPPNCLTVINNHQQGPFTQAAHFSATDLCEPQLLQAPSPDCTYSPVNGLHIHQQDPVTAAATSGQSMVEPAHMFSSTQKLSHQGPQTDTSLLSLQQLQLHDIFSPSIELPDLTVPDNSADDALAPFHSHGQASHMDFHQEISVQQANHLLLHQNSLQAPAMALPNNTPVVMKLQSPIVMDSVPPLIPCSDFTFTNTPNIPFQFSSPCLQESLPFEKHNVHLQQWAQIQQQKLPHASIMQNGHRTNPALQSQNSQSQALPCAFFLPRNDTGPTQTQQGGLAGCQKDTPSSCMFGQHFSSRPAAGDILPISASSGLTVAGTPLDQGSLQGSCCFQWSHREPVVGTSAIIQENVNNSPLIAPPSMPSTEHSHNIQHYLEGNKHILNDLSTAEHSGTPVTLSLM
ncbi:aryl hydrocarbon receptor-like isoform X2 [Archocentrus centrarchus]|uniref:aryl hydrocarbon receptor-like isoform X2 n=1 Tax=Archocentrus centrarchus TaxID=63155 RepID=UPI0011E9D8C8|nr:aryl hydrocarbon receptor-like isoform X2 [Archocentrus centrarchus]